MRTSNPFIVSRASQIKACGLNDHLGGFLKLRRTFHTHLFSLPQADTVDRTVGWTRKEQR